MVLKIKKISVLFIIISMTLLMISCEWGLEVIKVEIGKLPDRIIYIANVDTELDFGNSTSITTIKQGDKHEWLIRDDKSLTINHNVDFSKTGIYEVEILYANTVIYDYLVQVIDDNIYEELKNN